jgi:CMP-N-acetylneuraminic acid synthetase
MKKNINIAIIPARIGSKRIKKKNIKLFDNKPIIQKTFEIIKKSKLFNIDNKLKVMNYILLYIII